MKRSAQFLTSLYGRLLALYPHRYRGEYGDELRTVFSIAAGEAAEDGLISSPSWPCPRHQPPWQREVISTKLMNKT